MVNGTRLEALFRGEPETDLNSTGRPVTAPAVLLACTATAAEVNATPGEMVIGVQKGPT
jgi:hypothetical protein